MRYSYTYMKYSHINEVQSHKRLIGDSIQLMICAPLRTVTYDLSSVSSQDTVAIASSTTPNDLN